MTACYLEYHFKISNKRKGVIVFSKPIDILRADDIHEVWQIFNKVENYIAQGYYVAGYVSYEAAPAFNQKMIVKSSTVMPLVWFGVFEETTTLRRRSYTPFNDRLNWAVDTSREEYEQSIKSIHQKISEGATYQVNYSVRLTSEFKGDNYAFFRERCLAQQANYSAYLDIGTHQILSLSPELFFSRIGDTLITKPMKGTIGRGTTLDEDFIKKQKLLQSKKNRAENVMIVDLLRNDLGKIAKTGSVRVTSLFDIETYPTIHQLTSTVTAKIKKDVSVFDIFKALFPCGSVTGAPKISTMKMIHDLEKSPREVYCGAIGFIEPNGTATFNVPIRTVWIDSEKQKAIYGTGGGIIWDSTEVEEYKEMVEKSKVLTTTYPRFKLLESLKLKNGVIDLLESHLTRMGQSAAYFGYPFDKQKIKNALLKKAGAKKVGLLKMRVLLDEKGNLEVETHSITEETDTKWVHLSSTPVPKNHIFLYHKTTNRLVYHEKRAGNEHYFDTLLWNEDGFVTEFTNGNIVYQMNGEYYTPPIKDGLLPGTYRERLIKNKVVQERSLRIKDISCCEKIWFINSLRGWVRVRLYKEGLENVLF